jgi:uncharacterized damage-inducible protein DinB
MKQGLIAQLKSASEFFNRSTSCLSEEDSNFSPSPGTWTAAQQVAHTAQTIDWFLNGMFEPSGFDLDFEKLGKEVEACQSLAEARRWFEDAVGRAVETIEGSSENDLVASLPEGPVMGGAPRIAVISAIVDHTAHHRGALTVYSRLLGKVPKMPYMD